ncbi:capping complex subunit for YIEGIA [Paenibacillus sp. HJGM_3]|uniref:capping complex subunit for YIEGIA n=1 Tax=Paenibacillus sp. HJGM_3 TaxID=3379816 RepID=UPI00385F3C33
MSGMILAIVTTHPDMVAGGAPIFRVPDAEELQKLAFSLEKILDASAHDLRNGSVIIVKHR